MQGKERDRVPPDGYQPAKRFLEGVLKGLVADKAPDEKQVLRFVVRPGLRRVSDVPADGNVSRAGFDPNEVFRQLSAENIGDALLEAACSRQVRDDFPVVS